MKKNKKKLKVHPLVRRIFLFIRYGLFQKPFFRPQVILNVKNRVSFRIDYIFSRHKYKELGEKQNSGFLAWIEACRGKRMVFDVGAHIGLYTIPASQILAPDGKVLAFEPSTTNVFYLKKHLGYNQCRNVEIEQVLVGDVRRDRVEFYENLRDPNPMNSVIFFASMTEQRKVYRPQITLDDFCRQKGFFPDLMKIDIEGAELKALKGSLEILRHMRPLIVISVHPNRIRLLGNTMEEFYALVNELDYHFHYPDGQRAQDLTVGEYLLIPGADSVKVL